MTSEDLSFCIPSVKVVVAFWCLIRETACVNYVFDHNGYLAYSTCEAFFL